MKSRKFLALGLATVFAVGACTSTSATPSPASQAPAPAAARRQHRARERRAVRERGGREPERRGRSPPDPAEAVITGRRAERRDQLLDVLPVADVRQLHQGHDRPLRGDLSGRQGQLGRPPGDVPGRPEQRVRRRQRAGRHQPLGQRGLGQRVRAARACCCRSTTRSRRPSRTSTSRASGRSSSSTARTTSSPGTRASASS